MNTNTNNTGINLIPVNDFFHYNPIFTDIITEHSIQTKYPPRKPIYLVPNHDSFKLSLEEIYACIEDSFNTLKNISWEKMHSRFMYKAMFDKNTKYCEFEIFIYRDNDSQYIVEANRLSGDAFEFCHIYKNMHNRLAQKENRDFKEEKKESNFTHMHLPKELYVLDVDDALIDIINLAKDKSEYSNTMAAQIFCSISTQEELVVHILRNGIIEYLANFSMGNNNIAQRYAINALYNFAQYKICRPAIITTGILDFLIEFANRPGNYETNLLKKNASSIVAICNGQKS